MLFEEMLRNERSQGKAEGVAIGKAEGLAIGKAESILELLGKWGEVTESLRDRIMSETDLDELNRLFKAAAHADSMEQFLEALPEK